MILVKFFPLKSGIQHPYLISQKFKCKYFTISINKVFWQDLSELFSLNQSESGVADPITSTCHYQRNRSDQRIGPEPARTRQLASCSHLPTKDPLPSLYYLTNLMLHPMPPRITVKCLSNQISFPGNKLIKMNSSTPPITNWP